MATTYEWVVETLDWYEGCGTDPDVIDPMFCDSFREALAKAAVEGGTDGPQPPCRIGLVRRVGDDLEGETNRCYAYVTDDGMGLTLSPRFEYLHEAQDGPTVPKRFHAEVARG